MRKFKVIREREIERIKKEGIYEGSHLVMTKRLVDTQLKSKKLKNNNMLM